ncbi:uncharacterized protein LOC128995127 isoform X2 [Macrosteles quadrilineatus]|nr:uncharacterized protein LOC128995127 isoform X2 [Macrosteles quadrilineatus]XP_054276010.1 uncharacterized protein LOC128995127 isoform X2 [Macrosteles quadrilineatus]
MLPNNLNPNGYTSCIKISGIPILPPLITDERRKEINNDKQKAVEVEKKLKGKRSSIDSGVMTGSYTDHLKNTEFHQSESQFDQSSFIDLTLKKDFENDSSMQSFESMSYAVSDSFLKTALEDPEFRDFFSSTAEKIFKDNKIETLLDIPGESDTTSLQLNQVCSKESEIQSSAGFSESSFQRGSDFVDLSFSDNDSLAPSVAESKTTLRSPESIRNRPTEDDLECRQDERPSLPPRIRRNSYTLESPSPVLLEHMAKEKANNKTTWQTLPDKKEKTKGPGFKTFSGRSQRKHWNKNACNQSSILGVENYRSKYTLRKSNTFVMPETRVKASNYSLPASSRTSPVGYSSFTRSVDCLKSLEENSLYEIAKQIRGNLGASTELANKMSRPITNCKDLNGDVDSLSTSLMQNVCELQSASSNKTSPTSLINNPSSCDKSFCSTEHCSPPQIDLSDSASQISVTTQSTYIQKNSHDIANISNGNISSVINHSDLDDLVSLCSSMSISRYLPTNDTSRPSTAEYTSGTSIHLLKIKHENELRELLEKQRKEEQIYSQLISTSGSLASRTTTNLSNGDPFDSNHEVLDFEKKDSCSRELFPKQKPYEGEMYTKHIFDYSEREKEAATKLTACAKGYLTRRLLKTEKVQQLIELIKESLTCAFALQKEPHLKPNDLELHARLAHQLNAALCELQDIVSAPVSTRMAIISADRERLRRPTSRPSSAISAATRKSILRRQQSLNSEEKKPRQSRTRTKSFSDNGYTGPTYGSRGRSGSASTNSSRQPWR